MNENYGMNFNDIINSYSVYKDPDEGVTEEKYIPRVSCDNRDFLVSVVRALGEDEAKRIINKLNDLIIAKEFSISETIDSKLIEFLVTRE